MTGWPLFIALASAFAAGASMGIVAMGAIVTKEFSKTESQFNAPGEQATTSNKDNR